MCACVCACVSVRAYAFSKRFVMPVVVYAKNRVLRFQDERYAINAFGKQHVVIKFVEIILT